MLDESGTSPQRLVLAAPILQRPGSGIQGPFHIAVLCLNSDKVLPWKPDETTRGKPSKVNASITHVQETTNQKPTQKVWNFSGTVSRELEWGGELGTQLSQELQQRLLRKFVSKFVSLHLFIIKPSLI